MLIQARTNLETTKTNDFLGSILKNKTEMNLFANYRYFCIIDQQPSQKVADLLCRGALKF